MPLKSGEVSSFPTYFFRTRFLPAALVVFPCEIRDEEVVAGGTGVVDEGVDDVTAAGLWGSAEAAGTAAVDPG